MFCSSMLHLVTRNVYGALIIAPNTVRMIMQNAKLYHELSKPKKFLIIKNSTMIVSFFLG
jgi:hypothetical protein